MIDLGIGAWQNSGSDSMVPLALIIVSFALLAFAVKFDGQIGRHAVALIS